MGIKNGKRQEFESGALRSDATGRGRFDLISPYALQRLAIQYEIGGKQKGERNWEQGFPISRACSSNVRHVMDQLRGDRSEDHYAAAAWQLFCAMHFEELIKEGRMDTKWNDLPLQPPRCLLGIVAVAQVDIPANASIITTVEVYHAIMTGQMFGEIVEENGRFVLQCKEVTDAD